jgi:Domain of unknown function (DUF4410)
VKPRNILMALLVPVVFSLVSCAGASVEQHSQQAPVSYERPTHIVIYPFAVDPDEIELNRGLFERAYRSVTTTDEDEKQAEIADDISQSICLNVAADLSAKGYKAVCQKRGVAPIGDNVIVIDGEFNDISEGNRLSRTVIGFGAGASTLDTNVYVIQKTADASKQVLTFSTHADSGKMPGVAVTGAPGAAAGGAAAAASLGVNMTMSAVKGHRSSMSSLAKMTSDEIVEHLQAYLAQLG